MSSVGTYKKQRTSNTVPSYNASRRISLLSLPREVLSLVVSFVAEIDEEDEANDDSPSPLFSLSLVSTSLRSLTLPYLLSEVELKSTQDIVKTAKLFKIAVSGKHGKHGKHGKQGEEGIGEGRGAFSSVQDLTISLADLYSSPPAKSTLVSSLSSLILSCSSNLTSLTISLGTPPSTAVHTLTRLFPFFPSGSPFSSLTSLSTLRLQHGTEIWLHDLAVLLSLLSSLTTLELASLRGDCTRLFLLDPWSPRPQLEKLVLRASTLTAEMVAWLFEGQESLRWIEMPLPGVAGGEKAWKAVEKGAGGLEVSKVWDGWTKPVLVRRAKKGEKGEVGKKGEVQGEEEAEENNDDEDDLFEYPPSPLLPLIIAAFELHSLLITAALLPSAPSPDSFELLLPHLNNLEELFIEDTAASGLRSAVETALKEGELPALEKLVSVGVKKRKGKDVEEKKLTKVEKKFESVCRKHGVEWLVESA
ncbi:hypothetical protein JCM8547_007884 [Rhodosporidiobolus lusitaniae]